MSIVARNDSFLAHAKSREVPISVELAAETVQVTTIVGKPRIAVVVILRSQEVPSRDMMSTRTTFIA